MDDELRLDRAIGCSSHHVRKRSERGSSTVEIPRWILLQPLLHVAYDAKCGSQVQGIGTSLGCDQSPLPRVGPHREKLLHHAKAGIAQGNHQRSQQHLTNCEIQLFHFATECV